MAINATLPGGFPSGANASTFDPKAPIAAEKPGKGSDLTAGSRALMNGLGAIMAQSPSVAGIGHYPLSPPGAMIGAHPAPQVQAPAPTNNGRDDPPEKEKRSREKEPPKTDAGAATVAAKDEAETKAPPPVTTPAAEEPAKEPPASAIAGYDESLASSLRESADHTLRDGFGAPLVSNEPAETIPSPDIPLSPLGAAIRDQG